MTPDMVHWDGVNFQVKGPAQLSFAEVCSGTNLDVRGYSGASCRPKLFCGSQSPGTVDMAIKSSVLLVLHIDPRVTS